MFPINLHPPPDSGISVNGEVNHWESKSTSSHYLGRWDSKYLQGNPIFPPSTSRNLFAMQVKYSADLFKWHQQCVGPALQSGLKAYFTWNDIYHILKQKIWYCTGSRKPEITSGTIFTSNHFRLVILYYNLFEENFTLFNILF